MRLFQAPGYKSLTEMNARDLPWGLKAADA
jgi:hypothetical protein